MGKIPDPSDRWMNRSPGYDCLICGDRANYDVALMSVYQTRLCLDHLNEFHEWVLKRGWLRALHIVENQRDAIIMSCRGKPSHMKKITKYTRIVDLYKDKLYYETKRWVQLKIAEHKKDLEAEAVGPEPTYPEPKTTYFEGD